jgi:cytochrome c556
MTARIPRAAAFALLGLALLSLPGTGWSADDKKEPSSLMKQKLVHAQKLLEAITMNRPDQAEAEANSLVTISQKAEFMRALKTPDYEVFANDFRRTAGDLAANAKKKNMDAAALNYVSLTLSCVRCHQHVRDVSMARLD